MGWFVASVVANPVLAGQENVAIILLMCLVTGMIASALAVSRIAHRQLRKSASAPPEPLQTASSLSAPTFLFDPPQRWLAVRTHNPELVQGALGLNNPRDCSWSDAMEHGSEPRLFIAPAVRGWVLVIGCDLPDPSEDIDECFRFLGQLSAKVGEVHFFVRNRAVSYHGWARFEYGKAVRGYMWAGETLWNQGALTEAERDLKLRCLSYTESADVLGLAEHDVLATNTEKVIRLAAEWSIDPTALEAAALESKGIAGDLLHSKLH